MMRTVLVLEVVVGVVASSMGRARARDPLLEIDHVFLVVTPGAQREVTRLTAAGITFDTAVTRHDGGGTASKAALFANAYLELAWVDSTVSVAPGAEARAARFDRAARWQSTGVSPIGVGLRRTPGAPDSIELPSVPLTSAWIRSGSAIIVLATAADSAAARLFVVPRYMAQDAWVGRVRQTQPALFQHRLQLERLTRVRVVCPAGRRPSSAASLGSVAELRIEDGNEHLLELEFDSGRQGRRTDFRPELPLLIKY